MATLSSNVVQEVMLRKLLTEDAQSMDILRTLRELQLPDWAIGAGFMRALVWNTLSSQKPTQLEDVDVLFFDPTNLSKSSEKKIDQQLSKIKPDVPWSAKNQARMHLRNKTKAALSTEDAMRFWLETPTAVAARIDAKDKITILAPFGLDDLFQMIIRPTPAALSKVDQFESRLDRKDWRQKWPDLKVIRA